MKHGPNALIDETLPVVVLATKDDTNRDSVLRYEKTLSNIQEVTARSGKVIAVATRGDDHIGQLARTQRGSLVGLGAKTLGAVLNAKQSARPGQSDRPTNVDAVIPGGFWIEAQQTADWRDR